MSPRLRTFFVDEPPAPGLRTLRGPEFEHLSRAVRLGVGDPLRLIDGAGGVGRARVTDLTREEALLTVEEAWREDRAPGSGRWLATALPKGRRARALVEKATELGATRFSFLSLHRASVTRPGAEKMAGLQAVAREALKQCGRTHLPAFDPSRTLADFLEADLPARRVLLAPDAGPSLARWAAAAPGRDVVLVAGPEGGLTGEEQAALAGRGFEGARLSGAVLRVETACLAALAVLEAAEP